MWEPLLEERKKEKSNKYRELAADMAIQHPGWKVDVMAAVVGSLGVLRSFRSNISHLRLFSERGPQINPRCPVRSSLLCSETNPTALQYRNVTIEDVRRSTLLLAGIFR